MCASMPTPDNDTNTIPMITSAVAPFIIKHMPLMMHANIPRLTIAQSIVRSNLFPLPIFYQAINFEKTQNIILPHSLLKIPVCRP